MSKFHLAKGEQIILESYNAIWVSRNDLQTKHLVLTDQKMHCFYKKKNGLFKKSTMEEEVFDLSSIPISGGEAQVFQTKEGGRHLLQIRFGHGVEKFYFPELSKKELARCYSKLHKLLDTDPSAGKQAKKKGGLINSILKWDSRMHGLRTAEEYISTLKEKRYLLVKSMCIPQNIISGLFDVTSDDHYQHLVYNECGECVFRADYRTLYDRFGNAVGSIEEHLFSTRIPLFEKYSKDYTVRFKGKELCQMNASISLGSRDISFSEPFGVEENQNHFCIRYKLKKLARVYIVEDQIQRGHVDDLVIGYDEPEQGALALLIYLAYSRVKNDMPAD